MSTGKLLSAQGWTADVYSCNFCPQLNIWQQIVSIDFLALTSFYPFGTKYLSNTHVWVTIVCLSILFSSRNIIPWKKKKPTSSAHNLIIISAFPLDSHLTWTPSKSASSFLPISTHRIINTTYSRVKFSQMIIIFTMQSTYLNKIEDLGIACLCCWKIHQLQIQFGIPVVSAKESASSIFVCF